MKNLWKLVFVLIVSTNAARSQGQLVNTPDASAEATAFSLQSTNYTVVSKGAHSRVWQGFIVITNVDGTLTTNKPTYTELATGMAHLVNGEWLDSSDQFSISATGAEATNSQHQVSLLGNINSSASVTLTTPEGKKLLSNILGLSYFDTATTNSVWIGETKDSFGQLLPPGNEALYPDAFSGCSADVIYLNSISRFEQLVVIKQQLPPCTDFGMNPSTTLLCVITEFLDPPQPDIVPELIGDAADSKLDFGIMQMIHGEAFALGSETNRVPVTKHWVVLDNRQCLFEAVPLQAVQPLLNRLPPATASLQSPGNPFVHKLQLAQVALRASQGTGPSLALPASRRLARKAQAFKLAREVPSHQGFAMDYTTITSQTNAFTFQGDTVYYVSGTVNLSATNNIVEGLTVIKFAQSPSATIVPNGLIWNTRPYAPAIFSAKDDNTVGLGDEISGSTGNPSGFYGGIALNLSSANSNVICNARFSYLSNALAGSSLTLRDVAFVQCLNGIDSAQLGTKVYNALLYKMGSFEPLTSSTNESITFENVTAHFCTNLFSYSNTVAQFTNCLFVCVTNWQPLWVYSNSCAVLNTDPGVFQISGAGSHYLTNGSPYRGAGTTNIDPGLLSDLRIKTTLPPITYSNTTFSTDTTFTVQALRDTNSTLDLGWHYDPLDAAFGGCTANANINIQPGTAMGWFRTSQGTRGIHMANSKSINFNGTATALTWWVRYNAVQEQATSTWAGITGWAGIDGTGTTLSVAPTVNAYFLHCSILAGEGGYGNHVRDNNGYIIVRSWSSEYGGGSLGGYATELLCTNSLFERTSVWNDEGQVDNTWRLRNCTFHGGQLYMSRSVNPTPVSVRDCTFDSAGWPVTDQYANNTNYTDYDFNAFLYGQPRLVTNGVHDVIVTNSFGWQTSWFGNYYLPTNSSIIKKGDVTASSIGLYHFTTQTNQTIEGTNIVTIGYHYVATDANGIPLDSNFDGVPDYIEDANGDGLVNNGELSWLTNDSAWFCFEPGSVTNAGVLEQTNIEVCAGALMTPPQISGAGIAPGLASSWTGYGSQFQTNPVNYAWGADFVPPLPLVIRSSGIYTFSANVEGIPSNTNCQPITTNVGTVTVVIDSCTNELVNLIDLDLGSAAQNLSSKTGFAAVGILTNDYWNYLACPSQSTAYLSNLESSASSLTGVAVVSSNLTSAWSDSSGDPMYGQFLYAPWNQTGTLTFTNLQPGLCNIYLYSQDGNFSVSSGTNNYGSQTNIDAPISAPLLWRQGVQYSSLTNISISAGQALTVTINPGASGWSTLCGLQLVWYANGPLIWSQPPNQTVTNGGTATFAVGAIGTPTLNYQWRANGTNISGATTSSFTKTNAQWTDAGVYSVVVTNVAGLALSADATLNVLAPPIIVTQPTNQTTVVGGNVNFLVAAGGATPLTFQWTYNGAALLHANAAVLKRFNVQVSDAATYAVIVSNRYGTVTSSNATLTVLVPPGITLQPTNQSVCAGTAVTFRGSATGTAPLSYQWLMNGSAIIGATSTNYSISSPQTTNTGAYCLLVSNVAGVMASSNAYFFVGQAVPTVSLNYQTNGSNWLVSLSSPQATAFFSTVYGTNALYNPTTNLVQAPYADAFSGSNSLCGIGTSLGVNLTKLPPPVISPTNGTFGYSNSSVTISLGLEDLQTMVNGIVQTELGRLTNSGDSTNLSFVQTLRYTNGYSDELIRKTLINNLRASSEYATKFGGAGAAYAYNANYLIEYSLDAGQTWSSYASPIPVSATYSLLARTLKASSVDKRTIYAYQPSTNALTTETFPSSSNLLSLPYGLFNIEFDTNTVHDGKGLAATGLTTNDTWNFYDYSAVNVGSFQTGLLLTNALGSTNAGVKLWAFTGPLWSDWRSGYPHCLPNAWGSYWSCWSDFLTILNTRCYYWGVVAQSTNLPSWANGEVGTLYYELGQPAWWLGWPLPDYWQSPLWLPAFDEPFLFSLPTKDGLFEMGSDGLTCASQDLLLEWLGYWGFSYRWDFDYSWYYGNPWQQDQPPAHIYITGLPAGLYQVYLYNSSPALVNGSGGTSGAWRVPSAGVSVPYQLYTTWTLDPTEAYIKFLADNSNLSWPQQFNWTNEPIWLDKTNNRIEIDFKGPAYLAGIQISLVATNLVALQPPAPQAVPKFRQVQLFWPPVNLALGYQIYRATYYGTNATNYVLVGATGNTNYTDSGIASSTLYDYYVVATNDAAVSQPSPTLLVETLSDPRQLPTGGSINGGGSYGTGSGYYWSGLGATGSFLSNYPPTLNTISPITLSLQNTSVFTIPFLTVLKASDASDPDGNQISFKIASKYGGSLTINGKVFDPVTNCLFNQQATVVWQPGWESTNAQMDAFTVYAFDGSLSSANSATVTIIPAPPTSFVGWGLDWGGELGNGNPRTNRYDPGVIRTVPVKVNVPGTVVSAAHNGVGAAVTADGLLWMWGPESSSGTYGCFGEGQNSSAESPAYTEFQLNPFVVQMKDTNGILQNFTNVTDVRFCGGCVLALRADGTLWSWGNDFYGELGRAILPAQAITNFYSGPMNATKKAGQITGFNNAYGQQLSVVQFTGDGSVLALCEDGSVWWWGTIYAFANNTSATLSGEPEPTAIPETLADNGLFNTGPTRLSAFDTGARVIQIAGDGSHFAALREDGTVWEFGIVDRLSLYPPSGGWGAACGDCCWFTNTPVQVTNLPPNIKSIVSSSGPLDGYNDTSYSLALMDDGTVYQWGTAYDLTIYTNPAPVPGLSNIVKIVMGSENAFALDTGGNIWAWGANWDELGIVPGSNEAQSIQQPQLILGIVNAQDIFPDLPSNCGFAIATLDTDRPTALRATPLDGQVRLDWNVYPRARTYNVYRSTKSVYAGGIRILVGEPANNTFIDVGLTNAQTYFYTVSAMVDNSETPYSAEVMVTPQPPPGAPVWYTNSANPSPAVWGSCSLIHLVWQPTNTASFYKILRSNGNTNSFALVGQVGGFSNVDTTIPAGSSTNYYYAIEACNNSGCSSTPSTIFGPVQLNTAACPPAPVISGLAVTADGYVQVSWNQVAVTNGGNIYYPEAYNVKYYLNLHDRPPGPNDYFWPQTIPINWQDPSFTVTNSGGITNFAYDTSYLPNRLIWFKLSAIMNGEEGPESAIVGPILPCLSCTNLLAPTNLFAIPGFKQVYLQWNDDSAASYYEVDYRTNLNNTNFVTITTNLVDSRFWHTNLTDGTNYEYRVRSWVPMYDSNSLSFVMLAPSPYSTNVDAIPLDSLIPNTNAYIFGVQAIAFDSMVYVHWESLTNQPTLCFVERKDSVNTNYVVITDTGYGLAYLDQQVTNGTTYTYRVTALDSNYYRFQAVSSAVTPNSTGSFTVLPLPGNSYVNLLWPQINATTYQVQHATQSGGPFETVATISCNNSFLHTGLQNGIKHFYKVTASMAYGISVDSPVTNAIPLGTLAPLPPASFQAQADMDQSTNQPQILFTWLPSDGAAAYSLSWLSSTNTSFTNIYTANTTLALAVPPWVTNGEMLTFQVKAISSGGYASYPAQVTLYYYGASQGTTNQVLLSIGGHDVGGIGDTFSVMGPTNLALKASVLAPDGANSVVTFYDLDNSGDTITIGSGQAPVAQITWFHVPQGNHQVWAEAVSQPASDGFGMISGGGVTYESSQCYLTVGVIPDLASYQAAITDLQLPAPGLPIVVSRSYDSRTTNTLGCLGSWSASWDQQVLQVSADLNIGWAEAGQNAWAAAFNQFNIADTSSHVVTVTLPGGTTAYFAAQLNVSPGGEPLWEDDCISLQFVPFSPIGDGLSCAGNADPGHLVVEVNTNNPSGNWSGDPLSLWTDADGDKFVPTSFTYSTPDGIRYIFGYSVTNSLLTWKLSQVIDRNGNSLTYSYNTNCAVTSIQHSNGRQVQFDYVAGQTRDLTNDLLNGTWIKLYDTIAPKGGTNLPIYNYFILNGTNALVEVDKLVNRAAGIYETNRYLYGNPSTSVANQGRLTEIYDARLVQVLHNDYGLNSTNAPDGHLIAQIDALGRVTSFGLDANNTLTLTKSVNGTNQSVAIGHDPSGAIASTQAGSQTITNSYNEKGLLKAQTDSYGNQKTIQYNEQLCPVSQTDPLSNTTSTDYNNFNQPTAFTDANGNTSYSDYDESGNLTNSVDAAGTFTVTAYISPILSTSNTVIAAGLPASQTQNAPGVTNASVTLYSYYNTDANSSNFKGELEQVVQQAVTPAHVVLPPSITNSFQYDANGNRTQETLWWTSNTISGIPITSQHFYDAQNRLIQTIDPFGRNTSVTYNKLGKQATITDSLGRVTSYTYDAIGNLIETLYPDGSVIRSTYDEKNRLVYSQERAFPDGGNVTTAPANKNIYDDAGNVIRVERYYGIGLVKSTASEIHVSGADTQYQVTINTSGTLASTTRSVYDLDGRIQFSVAANWAVTQYTYDPVGRRTNVVTYLSFTNNPTSTASIQVPANATGVTNVYVFDPNGNQTAAIDALGRETDYLYDELNRRTNVVFPQITDDTNRKERGTVYDGLGRKIRETDEAGVTTGYEYDFRGLLITVFQDYGTNSAVTTYTYDECGNELSQTDANLNTTAFQYDALGRRTVRILPDGSQEGTAYTDVAYTNGVKVATIAVTDFRGKTIVTTNDVLDRPAAKLLPAINAGETSTTVFYFYNVAGQLDHVAMSGNVNRTNYYIYDNLSRLVQKDTPEGVLAYSYTSNDLIATIQGFRRSTVPVDGAIPTNAVPDISLAYGYDVLGRLAVATNLTIGVSSVTSYGYDLVGNLDHFNYPNGVTHAYSYTEQNRLLSLQITNLSGTLLSSYAYILGPTGNRVQVVESTNSSGGVFQRRRVSYDYDKSYFGDTSPPRVYRLTAETLFDAANSPAGGITNVYDGVGNRTNRYVTGVTCTPSSPSFTNQTYWYNSRDELAKFGGAYDQNGNTLVDENGTTNGDFYDAENHLIARTNTSITVGYDFEGNRAWKKVGTTMTYYLLDDRNPSGYVQVLAEYAATNSVPDRVYAYGLELISLLVNHSSLGLSASTNYYCFDGQGSVRLLVGLTGAVTDVYDYDSYGMPLTVTEAVANNYRYTGQQWDPDLHMYNMRARYLNPNTGSFWTMDSSEGSVYDPCSLHKYLYGAANPIMNVDPTGHDFIQTLATMYIGLQVAAINVTTTASLYTWAEISLLLSVAHFTDSLQQGDYIAAGVDAAFVLLPNAGGLPRQLPPVSNRILSGWIKTLLSHEGSTSQAIVQVLRFNSTAVRNIEVDAVTDGVATPDIKCEVLVNGVWQTLHREFKVVNQQLKSLYGVICTSERQVAAGQIKETFVQIGDNLKNEPNWRQRAIEAAQAAERYMSNVKVYVVDSAGQYIYP